MKAFENWLKGYIEYKGIDLHYAFDFNGIQVTIGDVIEHAIKQKELNKIAIQCTLYILDIRQIHERLPSIEVAKGIENTKVLAFLRHIANGIYHERVDAAIRHLTIQGFEIRKLCPSEGNYNGEG